MHVDGLRFDLASRRSGSFLMLWLTDYHFLNDQRAQRVCQYEACERETIDATLKYLDRDAILG